MVSLRSSPAANRLSPIACGTDENPPTMAPNFLKHGTIAVEAVDKPELESAHKKVDRRLLLWYSFVYLIMRIHVSNISNSAIINLEEGTGIQKQLGGLTSSQWAWCLSIFYYPYLAFEPMATVALKKFSPSLWMSRIMITWVGGIRYTWHCSLLLL